MVPADVRLSLSLVFSFFIKLKPDFFMCGQIQEAMFDTDDPGGQTDISKQGLQQKGSHDVEELGLSVGGDMKWYSLFGKEIGRFLKS